MSNLNPSVVRHSNVDTSISAASASPFSCSTYEQYACAENGSESRKLAYPESRRLAYLRPYIFTCLNVLRARTTAGFRSKIILQLIVIVILCCPPLPGAGHASNPLPEQELERLQQVYRGFTSLRFTFTQITRTRMRERTGRGTAIFIRTEKSGQAGIMRWNYSEPDPQIILNDGEKLSIYTQKDHQLLITSAQQLNNDITYSFFAGTRNIADDFSLQQPSERYEFKLPGESLRVIRLIPRKPHPQIKAVQIWLDKDYLIRHLILEDPFNSTTQLTFTNIQTNSLNIHDPKVIREILDLHLPQDTEIVNQ